MTHDADRDAFLAEIRRTGEPLAILMYADWLEDQGEKLSAVLAACESFEPLGRLTEIVGFPDVEAILGELSDSQRRWFLCNCAERWMGWEDDIHHLLRPARTYARGRCTAEELAESTRYYGRGDDPAEVSRALMNSNQLEVDDVSAAIRIVPILVGEWSHQQSLDPWSRGVPPDLAREVGEIIETRWQFLHAVKILHLGMIPLTDAERMEYA